MYMPPQLIARWESKNGKRWLNIYKTQRGRFFYQAEAASGDLRATTEEEAITEAERMLARIQKGFVRDLGFRRVR